MIWHDMEWYGMIYRKPRKVNRGIYTIIHAFVSTLLSDVFSRQLACNLRLTTSHFYSILACVWLWDFVRFLCVCIFPPRMGFLSFYLCLIPLLACCVFYPGLSLYNRYCSSMVLSFPTHLWLSEGTVGANIQALSKQVELFVPAGGMNSEYYPLISEACDGRLAKRR